jgi:hypothetical protein
VKVRDGTGMADRKRYANDEQEERGRGICKIPPEAIGNIDRHEPEEGEVKNKMKDDHHHNGNTPEKIDLGIP